MTIAATVAATISGPGAIFFCFVVVVVVLFVVVVEVCYIFSPGTFRFVYASPPGENQRFSESKIMKMVRGVMALIVWCER